MPKGQAGSGKQGTSTNPVADDRNWIGRVQNELTCVAAWNRDWGFLAGDSDNLKMENATKPYNIDEQIQKIQEEMEKIQVDKNKLTHNQVYGKGTTLEEYPLAVANKTKNKDLKPCDRKLPKGWKKGKWSPPEDPFDPLKDLFKKK